MKAGAQMLEGKPPKAKKSREKREATFPTVKPNAHLDGVRHCDLCGHRLSMYNFSRVCFHHGDFEQEPYEKLWLEWSDDDIPLLNNGTPQFTSLPNFGLYVVRMQETGIGDGVWRG